MKESIKQNINAISVELASKYANNPIQAAFIFDRIFLRNTRNNLEPERQFKIVDEDCIAGMGAQARIIHKEYLSITSQSDKDELKNYALGKFVAEFKKHGVEFLEHYTPNKTSGMIPVSFDANVGRMNVSVQKSSSPSIQIINNGSVSDAKLQELAAMLRGYGGSIVFTSGNSQTSIPSIPSIPSRPSRPSQSHFQEEKRSTAQDADEKRKIKELQSKLKQDALIKHFGEPITPMMSFGTSESSYSDGSGTISLRYSAGQITGRNAAGKLVTVNNIDEKRVYDLATWEEIEDAPDAQFGF